jgi:hypothetical protein
LYPKIYTDLGQALKFEFTVKPSICETDENPKCAQLVILQNLYPTHILKPIRSVHERWTLAYPGNLFWVGIQQIQLRTEGRKNEYLEAVAP